MFQPDYAATLAYFDEREADVFENYLFIERQVHMIEHDDRCTRLAQDLPRGLRRLYGHQYSRLKRIWPTKKSAAITATDPATTEIVVDRPTPAVPPVVRRPT